MNGSGLILDFGFWILNFAAIPRRRSPIGNPKSAIQNSKTSVLLGLLAVLAAPALFGQTPAKRVVMKLATLAPNGSSYHRILLNMGTKFAGIPGGADLKVFAGGISGGEAEIVMKLKIGQLDAALVTANGLADIDRAVQSLQAMPMLFRSLDEVEYIAGKLRPQLDKKLRDKGFVALVWLDAGWVRFFSKAPIEHPNDLKKMKVFTWSGDTKVFDIYKSTGFQPVSLETNDILPMLSTGMINAVPLPPIVALSTQLYRTAPYMLDLNWAPLVGALVVTERSWNKLTPAAQTAMARAAAEAGQQMKAANRAETIAAIDAMKKRNLHVYVPTPAVEAEWQSVAESSYPRIRGNVVPADFFDEVRRLLGEYRSTHPAAPRTQ